MRQTAERKEKLGKLLQAEISRADGGESGDLQANRALAMAYYRGVPRGDEKPNRSDQVSTDVADMVNATLALLVPMIATDAVLEFEPNGDEDEQAVAGESQAVNKVIIEDNHGFIEIQEAVKDALLLRNGCMKVQVHDRVSVRKQPRPPDAAPEQVAGWIEQAGEREERYEEGGFLVSRREVREFETGAVPIENILYQAGYAGKLQAIRFFAERLVYTRSDLVELGIERETVDALQSYSESSGEEVRRLRDQGWTDDVRTAESSDQDEIECHECYLLTDLDGDGVSERYKVLMAGRETCLEFEPVDLVPYALGSPFLNPHRLTGESLFDHMKATQDVKTKLVRQLLDNTAIINNGRYAYDPDQTSEADVLSPRAGGGIRSRNPGMSVVPIPVPDVTSGILAALTYEDKRRTERGGAALEMLSADAQIVGETAHGIERQYAAREAMVSMMAKNLSETLIRGLWTLTHAFMREYATEPVMVRIAGQFQPMDPRTWPERTRCNATTGLSPGQRGHIQSVLQQTLGMQFQAMQAGGNGVIADMTTVYRTAQAWLRMASVDNPERLWIDPSSPAAQQAAQAQQQAAQAAQQAALQAEQQKNAAELTVKDEETRSKERMHAGDLEFKYAELAATTEVQEAEMTVRSVVDLETRRERDARGGPGGARGGAGRDGGDAA